MLVDLSHTVEHGLITYKGLPPPVISDHLSREHSRQLYAQGTEFQIGKIEMVANTGTYLDSPFHRYENGQDLSALSLEILADLDGLVVRNPGAAESKRDSAISLHVASNANGSSLGKNQGITAAELQHLDVKGKAVLFHTGWDCYWRTDKYSSGNHPFLTSDAAEYLAVSGVKLVGIDSYNIDDTADGRRPAHSTLLAQNIPCVSSPDFGGLRTGTQMPTFFCIALSVSGMKEVIWWVSLRPSLND